MRHVGVSKSLTTSALSVRSSPANFLFDSNAGIYPWMPGIYR